jgi:membrane-bound inhibitor of C-type lysozyme/uncharacterized membrane protein
MPLARTLAPFTLTLAAAMVLGGCGRKETPPAAEGPVADVAAPATAPATATAAPTVTLEALPDGVLHAYVWECDGGMTLNVRNLYRENAVTLDLHEGERKLPLVTSASGARYADETVTFWSKGSEATFERKGAPPVACRELRRQSLLADARLRGLAYRGTGNEPGWLVEVGPAPRLLFVTNFGEERHEFDAATTGGADPAGVTVFTAERGAETIKVTVARETCVDNMSGWEFDHRMVVEFGGRTLNGCASGLQ